MNCLFAILLPLIAVSSAIASAPFSANQPVVPRVFLFDGQRLAETRQRLLNGDTNLAAALAKLDGDAKEALTTKPLTVVDAVIAPSGDPHDYVSQAPYFWRNPETSNGLPYIRRDGERNPEIGKFPDHRNMDRMVESTETLAVAYYFTGNEVYAAKAASLVRAWFLDPATRMNPNLQYAQAIPGLNTGRGIGLIETRGFTRIVDAVGLLAGSKAWSPADDGALKDWFAKYLDWMLESKNGNEERVAKNNHGTYYDLQVASYALFVGRNDLATNILKEVASKRIALQIERDGREPLETVRTKAWSYSIGNLQGLFSLARLAENVGVDLWNYETADGRSIRKALDYLIPFAFDETKWPHQQIGGFSGHALYGLIRKAATKYADPKYRHLLAKMPAIEPESRSNLLDPAIDAGGDGAGWTLLFDGKTLNGWVPRGGKAEYRAADGEIIGRTVPNTANSFLCTTRDFTNFILEIDFKVSEGLNSGVQIRSHYFETPREIDWKGEKIKVAARRVHGPQVEIDPSARAWTGGLYGEAERKWLNDLKSNEAAQKAFKHNDWNHFRIECRGPSIKTWINGVPATDFRDDLEKSGFIALQVHAVGARTDALEVRFRNIRLKEL